ncbi:uncharacterized protein [Penaeus vannamei]|uniref:uncharacterized protein isoform X1 n=2 Tax=Penaeus vannamei TaxID=6689 RepID=UPI00387F6769
MTVGSKPRIWFILAMAEYQEVREAAGMKLTGTKACQIVLDENMNIVFLSLVWTSTKWDKCLAQITAVFEEDYLDAYVRPTRTQYMDRKYLKLTADLEWDGSTMKKRGEAIPEDHVFELEAALTLLVEWLKEKEPVVCVVGDFMLNDSCPLVNLLMQVGLYKTFTSICRGFVRGSAIFEDKGTSPEKVYNVRRFRNAMQAIDCDLQLLQEYSMTVESVQEYYADKERTYWARSSFKALFDQNVISKGHAWRLAYEGWTLKDMKKIYKDDGEEVLKAKLRLVSHDEFVNLQGKVKPDVLSEEDIIGICNFLNENL